eukprot:gb/GEZJ01002534.1/.p1 GENE.gb/GEZJ01002534.1/~~gb/GEZJ01002534.1/.p1  ORF type:complete len:420 (-),score=39.78 gb/GEZJ01002534.1/:27-1232(-)
MSAVPFGASPDARDAPVACDIDSWLCAELPPMPPTPLLSPCSLSFVSLHPPSPAAATATATATPYEEPDELMSLAHLMDVDNRSMAFRLELDSVAQCSSALSSPRLARSKPCRRSPLKKPLRTRSPQRPISKPRSINACSTASVDALSSATLLQALSVRDTRRATDITRLAGACAMASVDGPRAHTPKRERSVCNSPTDVSCVDWKQSRECVPDTNASVTPLLPSSSSSPPPLPSPPPPPLAAALHTAVARVVGQRGVNSRASAPQPRAAARVAATRVPARTAASVVTSASVVASTAGATTTTTTTTTTTNTTVTSSATATRSSSCKRSRSRRNARTASHTVSSGGGGGGGGDEERSAMVKDSCARCSMSAKHTPMMRKGPDGCRSLCNACGLKWSRHGIY